MLLHGQASIAVCGHRPTHSWFLTRQLIIIRGRRWDWQHLPTVTCRFNDDDHSALHRQYLLTFEVRRYCFLALYGSIGKLQLTLHQRLYSEWQRHKHMTGRLTHWRGVCLLTDRAVYKIIMSVFTSMTWRWDVCLPAQHSTESLQTFTCAIDVIIYIINHGVSSYYILWTI